MNINTCFFLLAFLPVVNVLLMANFGGFILSFEIYHAVYLLWLGSCQIKKQALSPLDKEFLQDH